MKVKIVEVGARDGLQNEKKKISLANKKKLITKLSHAGLKNIEVGAFVSPKWVPQMADSEKLVKDILSMQKNGKLDRDINFSALVPNQHGFQTALKTSIANVAVFASCTESFSKRNINCSIAESFNRFADIVKQAKQNKIKVRGYLSMAFGCPYEGKVSQSKVIKLAEKMLDMGIYEVSLGDTIGAATPKQVKQLLSRMGSSLSMQKVAMHFHDTRGTALANVLESLNHGVRVFDSSIGSLGGCPYAKGASGNLATEDLVYMLTGMGVKTGVDIDQLVAIKKWVETLVDRQLPSHVGRAGMPRIPVF